MKHYYVLDKHNHGAEWENAIAISHCDHECAAIEAAEYLDNEAACIISRTLEVKDKETGEIKVFKTIPEACIHYIADELDTTPKDEGGGK